MTNKLWSINVFTKDEYGGFSKDLYGPKYKWSYEEYNAGRNAFANIPSEGEETLCELMEYDFITKELTCIETKHSDLSAASCILPGKYQQEIK